MEHDIPKDGQPSEMKALEYREDLINAAMGAQRLTNQELAKKAGVGVNQVSAVRNGATNVRLETLYAIVKALDLTLRDVFQPKAEPAEASGTTARA
jgi:transcriptional regulator with XRE-family HTH domain